MPKIKSAKSQRQFLIRMNTETIEAIKMISKTREERLGHPVSISSIINEMIMHCLLQATVYKKNPQKMNVFDVGF